MYVVRIDALDDLSSAGCPVCKAADRVERAWLRGLLDDVGDAKVRSALERGGGLCAAHVRLLVEVAVHAGKTLGLGVVLEVLLSQARNELGTRPRVRHDPSRGQAARGWRAGWRARSARWRRLEARRRERPDVGCGACVAVRLRERAYAELLLAAGDAALQRRAGEARSALCRPHLAGVRASAVLPSGAAVLDGAAQAKVEQLLVAVGGSIAAHQAGAVARPDVHEPVLRGPPSGWPASRAARARGGPAPSRGGARDAGAARRLRAWARTATVPRRRCARPCPGTSP